MNSKPMYLNTLFKLCCYKAQNKYEIMKWVPNHEKFDKTNGEGGKRMMKIKERYSLLQRLFLPSSCRGYSGYYVAEYNRKAVFKVEKKRSCNVFCWSRPEVKVRVLDNDFETLGE
jgi:hypothetical protein